MSFTLFLYSHTLLLTCYTMFFSHASTPVYAPKGFWESGEVLNVDEALAWAAIEFPDAPEDDGDLRPRIKKSGRNGEKYELAKGDHGHHILPDEFRGEGSHAVRVDLIRTLVVCKWCMITSSHFYAHTDFGWIRPQE